ncbi:MAG: histidinol-phosphate transaminase [Candidatus Dadabacteria bacterium]|nr:histidinol-phosphate transaminase [Candidatus Dadabacteria bacterium]
MGIRCSFCDITYEEARGIIQKGEFSICPECLKLVKEILDEFSMGDVLEAKGNCSFCGGDHGGGRMVFQGKKTRICNLCINEIERELEGKKDKTVSKKTDTLKYGRETTQEKAKVLSLLKSRVKKGIMELSPYSVPHYECSVKLDGNESPFLLPDDVLERVLNEIRKVPINRYPDPEAIGIREKVSRMMGFSSDGILIGNGSDELIGMLMATFSGGTKRVLYPVPTFSMYRITGTALGLELVEVELDDRFDIDVSETLKEIKKKNPDLIFLASPNNPTGNRYSDNKIFEIIENSKGIVVLDEAYCDFAQRTFLHLIQKYENLVVLRSMSKVGFAGIRMGMLFGRDEIIREINKVRLPYNVNSFSQRIAEVILDDVVFIGENVQLIARERDRVFKSLELNNSVEAFPSDANFILFRVDDADSIFKGLVEKGVLIRNFNSPGRLENCLRVTIGTPEENDAFLKALGEILFS